MFPECSPNVPRMFPEGSPKVPRMFPECSLNVPRMFPECVVCLFTFRGCSSDMHGVHRDEAEALRVLVRSTSETRLAECS
eukprot:1176035-Prorocentrum_minimum.AAC.2